MTKNKFYIIIIVGLIISNLLVIGVLVFRKPPHPPRLGPKRMIIESLHFDKNQVDQFNKLIVSHRLSIVELKNKLDSSKSELYKTLTIQNNNEIKTDSIFSAISKINSKIELTNYNHFMDIKKICKDDQLQYFKDLTLKMAHFFSDKPIKKP